MKKNHLTIIASILFLTAAFLRLYNLEGFITFLGDQGRDAIIVKRIITFEHFPAIGAPSSIGQIYLGPFYYYLIAPWLLIFNFNPVGLGYGVAIMSIIGIALSYWIVKRLVHPIVAIAFLAIITFSFTLVNLSRFSWNPNLLPIFSFLTLYFFHEWLQRKKIIFAVVFGSLIALTIQLHHLAMLLFLPLGFMYLYHFYKTDDKKNLLTHSGAALGGFIFFSIPLIIFDLRHDFLNTRSFLRLFSGGDVVSEGSYINRLQTVIEGFFNFSLQIPAGTSGLVLLMIAVTLFFIWIIRKTRSSFLALHGLTFITFLLGFAMLSSSRHYHYYGPVYMSFYLLLASSILIFSKKMTQYIIATGITIAIIAINIPAYYFFYYPENNQITHAHTVAETFKSRIKQQPIQVIALPTTETESQYRFFLELAGYKLLPHDSQEQAAELYIMCFEVNCDPIDDPHWQIANFSDKILDTSWQAERAKIYKIVHKSK